MILIWTQGRQSWVNVVVVANIVSTWWFGWVIDIGGCGRWGGCRERWIQQGEQGRMPTGHPPLLRQYCSSCGFWDISGTLAPRNVQSWVFNALMIWYSGRRTVYSQARLGNRNAGDSPASKPITPAQIDTVVCAGLPDPFTESYLYNIISKVLIHGPCGVHGNPNAACSDMGKRTNGFPKPFSDGTVRLMDA